MKKNKEVQVKRKNKEKAVIAKKQNKKINQDPGQNQNLIKNQN